MNFDLTEDQNRIRDAVRGVRRDGDRAASVAEREQEERFPREILARPRQRWESSGMMVPEEYGGAGADALSYVLAIEELARVCASTAVIVSVNNSVFCYPVWKFGNEEQKKTILTEVASGEGARRLRADRAAVGIRRRQPEDARRARRGPLRLNGAKAWITNAGEAKWYLVMAMTDPPAGTRGITAFLVSSEDPGLRVGAPEEKMGLRASRTAAIFLEDVRIPASPAARRRRGRFPDRDDGRSIIRASGSPRRESESRGACFDASVAYARDARDVRQEARRARDHRVPDRRHAGPDRGVASS